MAKDRTFHALTIAAFVAWLGVDPAHAQGPTLHPGAAQDPGSVRSSLGPIPGAGGNPFGGTPGTDATFLGGRPGPSMPRVPSEITTPGGGAAPPSLMIGVPSRLKITDVPLFGPLEVPAAAEEEGPPDGLTLDAAIERLVVENLALRRSAGRFPRPGPTSSPPACGPTRYSTPTASLSPTVSTTRAGRAVRPSMTSTSPIRSTTPANAGRGSRRPRSSLRFRSSSIRTLSGFRSRTFIPCTSTSWPPARRSGTPAPARPGSGGFSKSTRPCTRRPMRPEPTSGRSRRCSRPRSSRCSTPRGCSAGPEGRWVFC